jgi:hypothetical protein
MRKGKEVLQAHVQQVMDVTGCSAERARRELEQHSVEFAINSIFDGPLNQEPVKLQKASSAAPSLPAGWRQLADPRGVPYFVGPSGQPQWEPPYSI